MKKVILVMSIFLGIFMGSISFAADQKSNGIDILNGFLERQRDLEEIFLGDVDEELGIKQYVEKLEDLKKDILNAKENSSKTIIDKNVGAFNKSSGHFIDVIDSQISFLNIIYNLNELGKGLESMEEKEKSEMEKVLKDLTRNSELFDEAKEALTK